MAPARLGCRPGSASSCGRTLDELLLERARDLGGALGRAGAAQHLEPRAQLRHAPRADVAAAAEEAVRLALEHAPRCPWPPCGSRRAGPGRCAGRSRPPRPSACRRRPRTSGSARSPRRAAPPASRARAAARSAGAAAAPTHLRSTASSSSGVTGLRDVVVHAGLEALLAVALHGARGHRDDRQRAARRASRARGSGAWPRSRPCPASARPSARRRSARRAQASSASLPFSASSTR